MHSPYDMKLKREKKKWSRESWNLPRGETTRLKKWWYIARKRNLGLDVFDLYLMMAPPR